MAAELHPFPARRRKAGPADDRRLRRDTHRDVPRDVPLAGRPLLYRPHPGAEGTPCELLAWLPGGQVLISRNGCAAWRPAATLTLLDPAADAADPSAGTDARGRP